MIAVLLAMTAATAAMAVTTGKTHAQDASTREAIEQRLTQIKAQIAEDERHLSETTEVEQASLETLEEIDRQVTMHAELVRTYGQRNRQIAHEMDTLRTVLDGLLVELEDLRSTYRSRAIHAYKYGRMHDLVLIASAESINQMLVRARYLRRFAQQRKRRFDAIRTASDEISQRRQALRAALTDNDRLLNEEQEQQQKLSRLRQSRHRVIADLREERSTLEESLEAKRAAAAALENRIREIIAAAESRRRTPGAADADATMAYAALSGSFLENHGNLPWPVRGVLRAPFGDIVNPVHGTKTPNPGIIIDTPESAEVRAVFDGYVIDVSVLPEFGKYVVIEHGAYKSVYSNFSVTYVAEGEEIGIGQRIGLAGTRTEPKGKALFFALFKDGSPVDPYPWLSSRYP